MNDEIEVRVGSDMFIKNEFRFFDFSKEFYVSKMEFENKLMEKGEDWVGRFIWI